MKRQNQDTILILGGDGYLGWTLGLAFANRTNKHVVLADNLAKRKWERQAHAKTLVPLKSPKQRIDEYERLYSKQNLSFEKVELLKHKDIAKLIRKYRPSIIINAAQQPSAPFAMKSPKHSALTFSNNIIGHLNTLWAIAQIDKNIKYIKLGSAGCYMDTDTDYLPLGKKDFTFEHRGKAYKVLNSNFPMQATDFYHQSKISDFLIDDLCARIWNLKVITVQQATIFGATIDENHSPRYQYLSARFNYDAVFGTVLNRFICQVVVGHPLTVYGKGGQKTGLISLSDTVKNFMKFAEMDIKPGKHVVVHNYTLRLSIEDIAQKIANLVPNSEIYYIKNPRKEPNGKLNRTVQVHAAIKPQHSKREENFDEELSRLIQFTKRYADRIEPAIIMPKVAWTVSEVKKQPLKVLLSRESRRLYRVFLKSLKAVSLQGITENAVEG